jgi:CubicO group peptidase (beta-lactamase class C family)
MIRQSCGRRGAWRTAPTRRSRAALVWPVLALAALLWMAPPVSGQSLPVAELDGLFASWSSTRVPGCAVGVARNGEPVLLRAWGMADLEQGIANTPETIFEGGSLAKQFTSAAVILLALDGKLSLEDDVRSYIPELPDYGTPITVRQLMTHTSGLRDWGSVAAIEGWGREDRSHTHAHVLEILTRQSALNYTPGERYSYTNSGYNLLAMIVDRVSGIPFAEFSRTRLFEPLGLEDTQWRDDYRRLVPGRSSAYSFRGDEVIINRPIEYVHGNGGILTTVEDLLRWDEVVRTGGPFGERFVTEMHRQAVLNDGTTISYASGVQVEEYRGQRRVSHTGSTAGYRGFLGRYPDQGLTVSLLCNAANVNPGAIGNRVADLFLQGLPPVAATQPRPAAAPSTPWTPSAAERSALLGSYHSTDANVTLEVRQEGDRLVLFRAPDSTFPLTPRERDSFESGLGTIRVHRDAAGAVRELGLEQDRVHDLRLQRVGGAGR